MATLAVENAPASLAQVRQEKFHAQAAGEVLGNNAVREILDRASSLSLGDEQKANSLYVKLRTDQLQREYERSVIDWIRSEWPQIISGKPFVCPYCGQQTVAIMTTLELCWGEKCKHLCSTCLHQLQLDDALSLGSPSAINRIPHGDLNVATLTFNPMALTGFILGLTSTVLYIIGIIPILGIVFSGIGIATFKPETQKHKWMAVVGLILSVLYTFMCLSHYGKVR